MEDEIQPFEKLVADRVRAIYKYHMDNLGTSWDKDKMVKVNDYDKQGNRYQIAMALTETTVQLMGTMPAPVVDKTEQSKTAAELYSIVRKNLESHNYANSQSRDHIAATLTTAIMQKGG